MEDLHEITVGQLIDNLRAAVARNRRIEIEAREQAERDERALLALEAVMGEQPSEQVEQTSLETVEASPNGDGPRGEAAVRRIMENMPMTRMTGSEIHAEIVKNSWFNPDAKHKRAGTDAAVARLVRKGVLVREGRTYIYMGGANKD
jgi:aminopeptidase N